MIHYSCFVHNIGGAHKRIHAHHGNVVVGVIEAKLGADTAYLKDLFVAPHKRRNGIGRRLLAEAEDQSHKSAASILVEDSEYQGDLISFYRSCGYFPCHEYASGAVMMAKRLC